MSTTLSGRYQGLKTAPIAGYAELDLRIDIDQRYANSPVMNRVSGDFYQIFRIAFPGFNVTWRTYLESWIVDSPAVTLSENQAEITGSVRFWKGTHPTTQIRILIPWSDPNGVGPAQVTFTAASGSSSTYLCDRKSDCFRDLNLEIDVCKSVNIEPLLPSYDTHSHPIRPPDLPQRTLTIEESYCETGIGVAINPDHTVIDDGNSNFISWSPAELHDAMEQHFSKYRGGWPKWEMWGLMAGTFDNPNVGGIMFDAGAIYGGAGEAPERQGFALFRNHSWFNNLVPGAPATQAQAWAMRHFLYTWVHEAGHAFNFLHSWNKNRPDALSWMNYDWKYDQRNGPNSFWSNFRFRFDDEELTHIRHGDRASVIMGGDPWSSGSHLEDPPGIHSQVDGQAPIELLLRSKEYFEFMEPVSIELRLRNLLPNLPLYLDTRLNPEFGSVIIHIRRPYGRMLMYAPICCKLATPRITVLMPLIEGVEGEDRYSETISISYGVYGFYFDEPGEYLVRALYQGSGDVLIPSNVHRIRIGRPLTKEEDRLAQDFFTYPVGMSLYLNGSRSPFLAKGADVLEDVADQYKGSYLGAKAAMTMANSYSQPFFRVRENILYEEFPPDPEKALALTDSVLTLFKKDTAKSNNLSYHQLVRSRTENLVALGKDAQAKREVATLRSNLTKRGVNLPVLQELDDFAASI